MWEWDDASKGDYDKNDWDFIAIGNGATASNIWIDHCTFTKAYDGIIDTKGGSYNITFSWSKYVGDDGATNAQSFVRQQIAALEANRTAYPMCDFLRTNGFSVEDIVQISQGHTKGHLLGANALDATNNAHSMTLHHQWAINLWDRAMPRLRAGNVHNYNNYLDDTGALAARRLRDTRAQAMSGSAQTTINDTYSFNPPLNGAISTEGGALLVEKGVFFWTTRTPRRRMFAAIAPIRAILWGHSRLPSFSFPGIYQETCCPTPTFWTILKTSPRLCKRAPAPGRSLGIRPAGSRPRIEPSVESQLKIVRHEVHLDPARQAP